MQNSEILIKSFKNDGSIHRTWRKSILIENNEDYFVLLSKKANVFEGNGREWKAREPAITIFPKNKWFNVIAMLKNPFVSYYVNLASPPIYENGTIKYVDYDLDLKLNYKDEIKVIDVNEYETHKVQFHYNPLIDKILKDTIEFVKEKMKKREFPFDDMKIIDIYYDYLEKEITSKDNK